MPALSGFAGVAFEVLSAPRARRSRAGGDWYDTFELPDGSIVIAMGDITGDGFEAAVLIERIRLLLRGITISALGLPPRPASVLAMLEEERPASDLDAGVAVFLGIISPDRRCLRYASAGHPPPLAIREGSEPTWLRDPEPALGWNLGVSRVDRTVDLRQVTRLVVYSDGLIDRGGDVIGGIRSLRTTALSFGSWAGAPLAAKLVERALELSPRGDVTAMVVTFDP